MAVIGGDPVEDPAFRGSGFGTAPGQGAPQMHETYGELPWAPGMYGLHPTGEIVIDPFTGEPSRTPSQFRLGWDPSKTREFGSAAAMAQAGAGDMANSFQREENALGRLGMDAQRGIAGLGAGLGGFGAQAQDRSQQVEARQTPTANFDPATAAIQNQMGSASALMNAANRTTGSGAQAQLRQGIDEAINSQMAIANSGSGFGANAAGLNQAAANAGALIGQGANQSAMLQAQTDQADAARQLSALGAAGDQYGSAAGAQAQIADREAQLQMQGMSANDARAQAMSELAYQYNTGAAGMGQAAYDSGFQNAMAASQFGADNELAARDYGLRAGAQGLAAGQLELSGANAALSGRQSYEQMLTDLYGIDKGVELGNRQLENGADTQNAAMGLSTAVALASLMSDERSKKNIRVESLKDRYAAIRSAA